MKQIKIQVDGKNYTLQHPGARWAMDLQNDIQNGNGTINVTKVLDEGLENCVFPDDGEKLSIDSFNDNLSGLNIWATILSEFILNGVVPKDKKGRWTVLSEPKKKAEGN